MNKILDFFRKLLKPKEQAAPRELPQGELPPYQRKYNKGHDHDS